MVTNQTIKKQLRAHAPQPKDNEAFMKDLVRQIDLLPSPESELQECLRRYTLLERLAMRMDAARWLLLGGTGSVAVGYLTITYYETIMSAIMTMIKIL